MDDRYADALHQVLAARGGFGHREHLELAWTYLSRYPAAEAERAMTDAIRYVANLHGAPERYHETLTRSWLRLVAVHRRASHAESFDEFMGENGGLLDRQLLDRHYSPGVLFSDPARKRWIAPDLRPLPASP